MKRRLVAVLFGLAIAVLAAAPASAQDPEWSPEPPSDGAAAEPTDGPPPGWDGATPSDGNWEDRPGADAPPPDQYEPALQPYGAWGTDPQYGRFWRPSVAAGWQPYWDGRWGYSPWGWTWMSYEPWNWTYHYGRWSYLPAWGWSWFPGYEWGPAWVSWNSYGNYVGWAPLGYWGRPAYNQYVFVRNRDFCAPYVGRRVVRYDRLPRGSLTHWRDHPGQPPPYSTIRRVGRYPMTVVRDRPGGSLAPWDHGSGRGRRADGPLVVDRGHGTPAPGRLDHGSRAGAPDLDHALRPDTDRSGGGVERPWRSPSGGRPTIDRPPLVTERGGRDAARLRPGAPSWSGGRGRIGTSDGGQMRGPMTIDRGGGGYRGPAGGGRASMGGGSSAGSMAGGRPAGGGGGISGGSGGSRGSGGFGSGGGGSRGGGRGGGRGGR